MTSVLLPRIRLGAFGRGLAVLFLLALWGMALHADPALPPKPTEYLTDEAHVIDAGTASAINDQLQQFERDTSNQILVAIYPALPDQAEIAQYATQTYNAWGVGQKGASVGQKGGNNGAILFVFINNHKMFIATGRGLEGALHRRRDRTGFQAGRLCRRHPSGRQRHARRDEGRVCRHRPDARGTADSKH
jgi:uncharacterized membrane protein YgcG